MGRYDDKRTIKRRTAIIGGLAAWVGIHRAEAAPKRSLPPLSEEERKVLDGIPEDPPPKTLSAGNHHFLVSDEHHAERFIHHLPKGGVYVGVGPEQSYLYASWARPAILILVDFDQMVVDLHGIYRAFFLDTAKGSELIERWRDPIRGHDAITRHENDPARRKALLGLLPMARKVVHPRLRQLKKRHESAKVKSFLTDDDHFDYVKALLSSGRARALRGDLTGSLTMRGVAEAAQALGEPVRCLYLSNVEFYFDYDSGLGDNCAAQPIDARSRVLRTVVRTDGADRYHYAVQRTDHFHAWLDAGVKSVGRMVAKAFGHIRRDHEVLIIPGPD